MPLYTIAITVQLLYLSVINCQANQVITPIADTTKPVGTRTVIDTNKVSSDDSLYLAKVADIEADPYSSYTDTALKGGYAIAFAYDKEMQYILYKKGEKIIDTLSGCSLGMLYKNLGYIGADFDHSFVFVQSYGSGNPHSIQLYDKKTLKNLIPSSSYWIDVDTVQKVLLYSKEGVPGPRDRMTLYDVVKKTSKDYPFPKGVMKEPETLNRIHFKKVSRQSFTIEYEIGFGFETRTISYKR